MQAARRGLSDSGKLLTGMIRSKVTGASPSTRDGPEVNILRAWLMFGAGIAAYTVSQELVSPRAGSFLDVNVRGDVQRQMAVAVDAAVKEGRLGAASDKGPVKHTWWWRLGHVKKGNGQDTAAATAMAEANRVKGPMVTRMA